MSDEVEALIVTGKYISAQNLLDNSQIVKPWHQTLIPKPKNDALASVHKRQPTGIP